MAGDAITGAYGADLITVQDVVNDPTWLQERIIDNLTDAFLEEGILRNGGQNNGAVAYHEDSINFLEDDPETVAEFAEIPISVAFEGKPIVLSGTKVASGVQISYEMIKENRIERLSKQVTSLQNSMVYKGVTSTIEAFKAANVPTLAVSQAWENVNSSNPIGDLSKAKRLIAQAKPDAAKPGQTFGYIADTVVMSAATAELMFESERVQKLYNGNIAGEAPAYKGALPGTLNALNIFTSPFIADGEVYVMQRGVAGFVSDTMPLTITPMYSPYGDNGFGGSNQTYRMDIFQKRIIAIDAPKAVVKLTGIGN